MRSVPLLLLLAAAASADGETDKALEALEKARPRAFERSAANEINPPIETLAASNDARAVRPLALLVPASFGEEDRIREEARKAQKVGAEARDRITTIDENLKTLEMQERAGRTDLGPEILRLKDERARKEAVYREVEAEVQEHIAHANYVKALRERVVEACESILRGVKPEDFPEACAGARAALDVANQAQALYLVRILRARPSKDTAAPIREVLHHPGASRPTILAAALALTDRKVPADLRMLVEMWKKDPEGIGPHIREGICRAAGQDLKTLEEASAWIATLKEE